MCDSIRRGRFLLLSINAWALIGLYGSQAVNIARAEEQAALEVTANWNETGHAAPSAADGDLETYWCTDGHKPGEGPSREHPDWLMLKFDQPITVTSLLIRGRKGYGPKECEWQISDDGKTFQTIKAIEGKEKQPTEAAFSPARARYFRLMIYSAYDAGSPDMPRHVAIDEISLRNGERSWPAARVTKPGKPQQEGTVR